MSLRIRQIVLAANDLDRTVEDVAAVLGVRVAFRDPLVAKFGLHNALLPIGEQFVEVVAPTRPGTAAGRLLERRGDSGYMLLLQTDDFARDRARMERLGVRIVWQAEHDDIRGMHLHPKDIGGAILSIDQPTPPDAWRWAGSGWKNYVSPTGARRVLSVDLEATDPEAMARRWATVLGIHTPTRQDSRWVIALDDGELNFVTAGARGDGVAGFTIAVADPNAALAAGRPRGQPVSEDTVTLGGAQFRLVGSASAA
ncbi:MAG: VOC family protein [Sulfurifustis sp.]